MEQFDLYVEEKEKQAAQGDVITEGNMVPFIENLANRLIQYVKDNPELEKVLQNHLLYLKYIDIDNPEEITFEQQKILAEINEYFSENIKVFLPNYNRNIPERGEYRIIIDRLLKVAVLQNFAFADQGMSDAEDNLVTVMQLLVQMKNFKMLQNKSCLSFRQGKWKLKMILVKQVWTHLQVVNLIMELSILLLVFPLLKRQL